MLTYQMTAADLKDEQFVAELEALGVHVLASGSVEIPFEAEGRTTNWRV